MDKQKLAEILLSDFKASLEKQRQAVESPYHHDAEYWRRRKDGIADCISRLGYSIEDGKLTKRIEK